MWRRSRLPITWKRERRLTWLTSDRCMWVCGYVCYLSNCQHTEHGGVQWVDALQLHPNFKTSSSTGKRLGLTDRQARERETGHKLSDWELTSDIRSIIFCFDQISGSWFKLWDQKQTESMSTNQPMRVCVVREKCLCTVSTLFRNGQTFVFLCKTCAQAHPVVGELTLFSTAAEHDNTMENCGSEEYRNC